MPSRSSPYRCAVDITICKRCIPLFEHPFEDAPAIAHLVASRRTSNHGHPYLMAQLRMVMAPMTPAPSLTSEAAAILEYMRSTSDRIQLKKVRNKAAHLTNRAFYRILDELNHHGYVRLGPGGTHLLRLDFYARPPLLDDLTPVIDIPATRGAGSLEDIHDTAARLLATLYRQAGFTASKRQIKKRLLLPNLPTDVFDQRVLFFHRVLVSGKILIPTHDGRYTLNRESASYTDSETYRLLDELVHTKSHFDFSNRLKRIAGVNFRRASRPNAPSKAQGGGGESLRSEEPQRMSRDVVLT